MPVTRKIDYRNSPTAWFVVLEQARFEGDDERAEQALGELRRLGVEIRFSKPRRRKVGKLV